MITRKSLADEIDIYDQSIADLNSGKKDCFDAYRDQLEAAGIAKPNIKAEIEAVKAAIRRRRAVAKDASAVEEKDALVDEILHEITVFARAPRAHVEKIDEFPPHDAVTGELTEEQEPADMAVGLAGPACPQDAAEANFKPARNPAPTPSKAAGQTGDRVTPPTLSPVVIPDYVPTFLITKPALRPHCLNPGENCGGQGVRHCHSCMKAMAESGVAA